MLDLKDAFDLATDRARPDPGALERQHRLQRRSTTRRKFSVYIAVAAVIMLVAAVILTARPPATDRIADLPNVGPGLYSLDVETGELTPFVDPGAGTFDFQLSPDGSKLLMGREAHVKRRLLIANADGTGAQVLLPSDAAMGSWFPDSRRIAYVGLDPQGDTRQVMVFDTVTGERDVLTDEPKDVRDPTVAPDGRTILYTITRTNESPRGAGDPSDVSSQFLSVLPPDGVLRAVDVETSEVSTLATIPDQWVWMHDVSPSGATAWVSGRLDYIGFDDIAQIHLSDMDGSHDRVLVSNGPGIAWVDCPRWSPDGSLLAYRRENPEGGSDTWVYDPATDEHRIVGHGGPETWLDDERLLIGV
jgi:Tol biopolymer transport system component